MDARIILNRIAARLVTAGVDTARLDARILLATALGRDDAVLPHETLSHWDDDLEDALARLVDRRLAGEPVSRIRGWREFWSLSHLFTYPQGQFSPLSPRPFFCLARPFRGPPRANPTFELAGTPAR